MHATPKDRLVLAFDDWQTHSIFDGIATCKDADSLLKDFTIQQSQMCDPKCTKELLEPHTQVLLDAVNYIGSKEAPMLLSVFAGGDPSLLIDYPKEKLVTYNPNPYHRNRVPGDRDETPYDEMDFMEQAVAPTYEEDYVLPINKQRKFNFASLVQGKTAKWLKSQNVQSWEIEYFGSRKEKQRRLKEGDMCKVYAQQWGCLMPGYDHAGSGWWRARPLQVADAGSILIGDPKEMVILYGDQKLAQLKAHEIEDLDAGELRQIAEDQKYCLYDTHPLDKLIQQHELEGIL